MPMSKTIILVLLSAIMSFAANHYVASDGTASWAASTNIMTPCSTRVAFDSAQAGDTAFFLQGTYDTPPKNFGDTYNGYYYPLHSGSLNSPIVFTENPNDTVVFDGTVGGSGDNNIYATIFGTNNQSWIVFDGFTLQANNGTKMARVHIGVSGHVAGRGNITVKNCIFNGGNPTTGETDNREGLRIDDNDNITVQNCYFYNYRETSGNHNTSALKTYHDTAVHVVNCEFYNNNGGVYFKGYTINSSVVNCYFHDNNQGFLSTPDMVGMQTDSLTIHNNLFVENTTNAIYQTGGGADYGTHGDDWVISNNTLYNNGSRQISIGYTTSGHGADIYNNIITGTGTYSLLTQDMDGWRNYLKGVDHTEWGSTFRTIRMGDNVRNQNYTSLANWQASSELENAMDAGCGSSQHPGCGDLSSDPQFVNTSGNMDELADFALGGASPCLGAGRSGADIGADVSTVGLDYMPDEEEPPTRTWHDSIGLSYTDSISSTDKNSFYVSAKNKTSGPKIRVFINLLGQKIDSTAILNNSDSSAVSVSNAATGTYYIVKKSVR
jgi:hypothetical protein